MKDPGEALQQKAGKEIGKSGKRCCLAKEILDALEERTTLLSMTLVSGPIFVFVSTPTEPQVPLLPATTYQGYSRGPPASYNHNYKQAATSTKGDVEQITP